MESTPSHAPMHWSYFFLPLSVLGRIQGFEEQMEIPSFFLLTSSSVFSLPDYLCKSIYKYQSKSGVKQPGTKYKDKYIGKKEHKARTLHVTDVPCIHSRDLLTPPPWARSWFQGGEWFSGTSCVTNRIHHQGQIWAVSGTKMGSDFPRNSLHQEYST